MVKKTTERDASDAGKLGTLGSLRLRHHQTNEIILVPTPSNDPNDPLNWATPYRYYIATLVCFAIFFSNFLAAGPTVAIVDVTITFEGPPGLDFASKIAHIAYFFTTTALLQGMGNLVWMPVIVKYGRRPAYVSAFILYTAVAAWAGGATSYGSELAARIIMGFASGAAVCLAPLTIADLFFLHERGLVMALYTAALTAGVSGGIIIAGLITIIHDWRMIYWVAVALIGATTILVIFTFPETNYSRIDCISGPAAAFEPHVNEEIPEDMKQRNDVELVESLEGPQSVKRSYVQNLRVFTTTYTQESLWKLFIRPVILLCLPPVLWATLVMSVTIGFLVAISSNFATAFQSTYGFKAWQSGLCFIASIIGSLIAIYLGGALSDFVADFFTRRNDGIREPEMRLPAIAISVVTAPLALVLYGVGIGKGLPWIVPTIGLGLLTFSIVQATNVTLVYTIDSYRPVAGEITVTQLAFKSAFGFLLSFYTNPWITESGYSRAFGAMAGISGGVMLCAIPMYFFGKTIRHKTWHWGFVKNLAHWDEDREVGE
jgi:MFS family permease